MIVLCFHGSGERIAILKPDLPEPDTKESHSLSKSTYNQTYNRKCDRQSKQSGHKASYEVYIYSTIQI